MAIVNKEGIVRRYNDKMGEGLAKSHQIVDKVFETIIDILKEGHDVRIQGFGVLKLKEVKERTAHIPSTGENKVIPAHTSVGFRISTKFKEEIHAIKKSAV